MRARHLQYVLLLLILLLAFALRVYRIDASALRGDEAFAVRYWAAPPSEVLQQLAWVEPHPFGTFFGFWAWKSLVGESELAMRMLPALLNLLGAAAMYALARRLDMGRWAALLAAFLWAVNPGLIWHSQDVRNYAPWAGLSAVALWLLVRAADKNRRIDWTLYVIVEVITLYVFFLEAFMLVVHGLYVVWLAWKGREKRWDRRLLQSFLVSAVVMGVLLIPWFYQAYRLAGSGYGGTAQRASLTGLLSFGVEWAYATPGLDAESLGIALLCFPILLVTAILLFLLSPLRDSWLRLIMLTVLPILLVVISLRLDVFRARYLLAIMPVVILTLIAFTRVHDYWQFKMVYSSLMIVTIGLGLSTLFNYYSGGLPKAPAWRDLRDYLTWTVGTNEAVIIQAADASGTIDPAFQYYYPRAFDALPRTGVNIDQDIDRLLGTHQGVYYVWSMESQQRVRNVFQDHSQTLQEVRIDGFRVSQFRSWELFPGEIEHLRPLSGAGGLLEGWSLLDPWQRGLPMSVIFYWQQLPTEDEATWKVFLHLINGQGQFETQADRNVTDFVGRHVYSLNTNDITPGDYTLRFGLYREDTGERAIISDAATGEVLGDYVDLGTITVAPGS